MNRLQIVRTGAVLLAMSLVCTKFAGHAAADESDYGPDWPICRNLALAPEVEIAACSRLLLSGKLTQQHTSWAYNNRGNAWMDLGKYDVAVADFSKAIEIDPSNAAPHFNMSKMLSDYGEFEAALKEIDRAIELRPDDSYQFSQRGYVLVKMHRWDEAFVDSNKALESDPTNQRALLNRSIVYFYRGNFDLSLADDSVLIELNPMEPVYWASRGQSYAALSEHAKAIADISKSLELAPDFTSDYMDRAMSYFALGNYALARADCETALSMDIQYVECNNYIARSFMLEGKIDDAIGKFSEIADVSGETVIDGHAQALLARGALRYLQGAYEAANKDFNLSIKGDPESPYGYLWRYLAGRRLGIDDPKPLEEISGRRDIWPSPVVQYVLGTITADDVLASADVPNDMLKKQRLAEANFYLGEFAALKGDDAAAAAYFGAAVQAGEIDIPYGLPKGGLSYLYKFNDDIEISLAKAGLHGTAL